MKNGWSTLKSEREYDRTLKRTIEIFHAGKNTPEGKELDLLLPLVMEYKNQHFHIPSPDETTQSDDIQ
jgi:HTH-type transcriptional regulator/antitoxin HigA